MTELETKLLAALKVADGHLTTEFYGLCYEPSPSDPLGVIRAAIAEAEACQQQAPQPSADGWIPWAGGECPLDAGVLVDVRYRDGEEAYRVLTNKGILQNTYDTGTSFWLDNDRFNDIVAYRIVGAPK